MDRFNSQNPRETSKSMQGRLDNIGKSITAISDGDASESLTMSQWLINQELKTEPL
jgi:hypothetical protein